MSKATPGYGAGYLPDTYSLSNIHIDPMMALKPSIKPNSRQPCAARVLDASKLSMLSRLGGIELTMMKDNVPKIPNI